MAAQRGLFDPDERYAALSKAGDPLERLAGGIDFELFRPELDATLDRSDDGARAPDETTIRRFREALVRTGAVKKLLARFDAHLKDAGYPVMGGGIPPDWQANPRKPAQKDRDARWTAQARAQEDAPGRHGDGRNRHAGVRLQIPYQCRPAPRLRPDMDRHRRRPASRCPCITRGPMLHGRRSDPRSNIPSPG